MLDSVKYFFTYLLESMDILRDHVKHFSLVEYLPN